ncbi:MAG: site-specific DNA-methyltransferase [Treponematales bacterium]
MKNLLIQGENIAALNYLLRECNLRGNIDLVYIDPPFATGINFIVSGGRASTISHSREGTTAYTDKITGRAFIEFLRERLLLLKSLLSDRGSIYLHTDYKIGHYVKVMMDEVFGIENFRNDITRVKCNPKNFERLGFGNVKDMILFYTKTDNPIWNEPHQEYTDTDIERLFPKTDSKGRRYTTVPLHAPGETKAGESSKPFKGIKAPAGRHWRVGAATLEQWDSEGLIEWSSSGNPRKIIYADEKEGKRMQDIWEYKDPQYPRYPTEKNADMLDVIIKTSSNENSLVLDCFCGSGTTLQAAQRNNRRWIGIDRSELAIAVTVEKLGAVESDMFVQESEYEFINLKNIADFSVRAPDRELIAASS